MCKEKAFISDGFKNWKKATIKFREHDNSDCHREAVERVKSLPQITKDIGESLSEQHEDQKRENRMYLIKVLSTIKYLARA